MTTRNRTLLKSGATALISLLRRWYRAVLAADIPLLSRCFAAVNFIPESDKKHFIAKAYRSWRGTRIRRGTAEPPIAARGRAGGKAAFRRSSPIDFRLRKIRRRARGQTHLEHVERVTNCGVVADDRTELDDALLAKRGDPFGEARIRQALGVDQLADQSIGERLVLRRELRRLAGADRLERWRRHPGLHRERRMRVPFIVGADVPRGQADRQLRQRRRQRR